DRGEAVEQADREDDEENLQRPQADDFGRAEPHPETADQVGEGNGEQTDVDLGLVAEGDGDDDSRDNEQAHHVEVSCCYESFSGGRRSRTASPGYPSAPGRVHPRPAATPR